MCTEHSWPVSITSEVGQNNSLEIRCPFPVNGMSIEFNISDDFKNDEFSLVIAENTMIGVLSTNTPTVDPWVLGNYTVGQTISYMHQALDIRCYTCIVDTVNSDPPTNTVYWLRGIELNVSASVVNNTLFGFGINLFDGVNSDNMGRVLKVDKEHSKIYVETHDVNDFLAISPTYVRQSIFYVKDWVLGNGPCDIYENKISVCYLPPDTTITAYYKNNGNATKTFNGVVKLITLHTK